MCDLEMSTSKARIYQLDECTLFIRGRRSGIVSMKMMMMVMRCLIRFGNLVARRRTGGIVHGVGKIIWGGFH